jgi:exodeoxyribonuclease VII large subunit
LARAIYRSKIPIISAVGHETDYTISDFVADLRAPTPSAAAELAVKDKREVKNTLYHLSYRLESQMAQILQEDRTHLSHLKKMLGSPRKTVETFFLRADELLNRLERSVSWIHLRYRDRSLHLNRGLYIQSPKQRIVHYRILTEEVQRRLEQCLKHLIEIERERVKGVLGKLDSLSPLSILQRGYSITRKVPTLEILRDAIQVSPGIDVEVRLHRGALLCEVKRTTLNPSSTGDTVTGERILTPSKDEGK